MARDDFTSTQIEMLGRRWREDPSPHLSLQLADLHRQVGARDQAIRVLEEGLEAHPGSVSVRVALGRYRMEAGDSAGAAEALGTVVDLDPGHLVANKLLVRAYLALGQGQRARDRLALYELLNDSDPELETLRAAVEGRAVLPPLGGQRAGAGGGDAGRTGATAAPVADLTRIPPPPTGRVIVGAVDREPFGADRGSWASPWTGIFAREVSLEHDAPAVEERPAADDLASEGEATADRELPVEPEMEAPSAATGFTAPEPALDVPSAFEPTPGDLTFDERASDEATGDDAATIEAERAAAMPAIDDGAADEPLPAGADESELPVEAAATAGDEGEMEEGEERAEAADESPSPVEAGVGATATLGALYLSQGHLDEAEGTFRQVLERDPDDLEAQAGLAELEARRAGVPAVEDEREDELPEVAALRRYLGRIRKAAGRSA